MGLDDLEQAIKNASAKVLKKVVSREKPLAAAGDYAAEDVLSESATLGSAWLFQGLPAIGRITKAQAICSITALTPRLTLYLFRGLPTSALNDNVANTALLHADLSKYIGKIDFTGMEDLGGDSESIVTPSTSGNLPLDYETEDNSLWGVLVTRDAITGEVAGMSMTIRLTVES